MREHRRIACLRRDAPLPLTRKPSTKTTGDRAEAIAAAALEKRGFVVVGRNVRVGRLEIDVIAQRDRLVVFCEVRARSRPGIAAPYESIDRRKIDRLRRAALGWLAARHGAAVNVRFDVVSIVLGPPMQMHYFENAF